MQYERTDCVLCLELARINPLLYLRINRECARWRFCEPSIQFIRILFQWYSLVGAAAEKVLHVLGSELCNPSFSY